MKKGNENKNGKKLNSEIADQFSEKLTLIHEMKLQKKEPLGNIFYSIFFHADSKYVHRF